MIHVKRPRDVPTILGAIYPATTKWPIAGSEFDRALSVFDRQTNLKGFKYSRYKETAVKNALEKLFHGKCAYCETFYQQNQPVDIEHYRPKGNVQGTEHSGYWWLAADWENLLPSCIDCNRRRKQKLPEGDEGLDNWRTDWDDNRIQNMGKKDLFLLLPGSERAMFDRNNIDPVTFKEDIAKEQRLLLDPTRDDPSKCLRFNVGKGDKYSLVFANNENGNDEMQVPHYKKGVASIQTYGLNRLGLVQARTRVLRDLEFMFEMSVNLEEISTKLETRAEASNNNSDIVFLTSIHANIRTLLDNIMDKFHDMMGAEAPFSALVNAWFDSKELERVS